MQHISSAISET